MKHTCFFVYNFIVQASIRDKLSQMAPVLDSIAGLAVTAQSGLSSNQTYLKISVEFGFMESGKNHSRKGAKDAKEEDQKSFLCGLGVLARKTLLKSFY